ncbi:hypothetical protein SUGI_0675000 [Cryptomeria japonica]|uniref:disease resistance protein Roq1-like n=1 Tax=Cryptomeria japonica TaxID=3369 RepID=UPI002414B7B2|nr:disease resistance protein Roq1-like [Cryptomeria japonica]GLJ33570.1 hypothetical protein SUGI_0675000 [Cryptomeria japonica]
MASSSSSHQRNAFSRTNKMREVEESSGSFDVFINHEGPDVKQTLATQIYNFLKERDIQVFVDSQETTLGESFHSIIETAISSASVLIAIFSKKYAESTWCLAELVLMLQSKAKIIHVFYEVEPWELRHIEKGVYAEAFRKHESDKRHLDKIEKWKEALQQVSYTAGHIFKNSE